MKQTHKRRALGDIAATIQAAPSITAAAASLGVNRSSVHRWIKKGVATKPTRRRRKAAPAGTGKHQTPVAWAKSIRLAYALSDTEMQLLDLAKAALLLARNENARPADRLAATTRFQALVRQLDLEDTDSGEVEKETSTVPTWPRRVS